MATVTVTEFAGQLRDRNGLDASVGDLSTMIGSTDYSISDSASSSNALSPLTSIIRVLTSDDCRMEYGSNPTATATSGIPLKAGIAEYFGCSESDGNKLSFITT